MRRGSCRAWERWLAALVGVTLAVFGVGGVAVAAEQIAAEAPVPTDPRAFGGYYVMTAVGGGVRVRGHLVGRRRAHRVLAVARQLGCSPASTSNAKTLRTDGRGRFSVTLPTPPADQLIAVYRLRTTSGGRTYTLPLVLRAR
jgi:hypothetical protein